MKHISAGDISAKVADLCIRACTVLPPDVVAALEAARDREESQLGRGVLSRLLDNARIAQEDGVPMCQDTGLAVVFVEMGEDVRVGDGNLYKAIAQGVREGYEKGSLRKSVVQSPLDRRNTGDNTPPIIHAEIVPGERLKIAVAAKGAGSENMSRLRMMAPADGEAAIKRFVRETVEQAGASACPPVVVGVGLGGNFEQCALIAKKALLRPMNDSSPVPEVAAFECDLLEIINRTGIGPMAVGGRTTALAVKVETAPCHIASMPVAVNLQCHAARHAEHIWE